MKFRGAILSAMWLVACGPVANRSSPIEARGSALETTNTETENTAAENTAAENTSAENTSSENTSAENFPGENFPGENFPGENFPGENFPGENNIALDDLVRSIDISPITLADGTVVTDASITASIITGHANGKTYTGADFTGATLSGTLQDGSRVALTLGAYAQEAAPNSDLGTYVVTLDSRHHHHHANHSLCLDANGNPQGAIPVYGYWDYSEGTATGGDKTDSTTKFTFACQEGAIGKCINWGYRPWSTYNGVSLAPYHQTCTRMTRADYCGDGMPHTVAGAWINLYDNQGINTDDEPWIFEAKWSPTGATCLNPSGIGDHWKHHISCYHALASTSCGADDPSAMLNTETPYGLRSTQAPPP